MVLVMDQFGARVVDGWRERLWAGEAIILAGYVANLVLGQAR